MQRGNGRLERKGIFYGWFSLAGVMLVILVAGATLFGSFAVFLPVICNEFNWSRASVASALSVGMLSFGLPSPIFGLLISRFGPRSNIIIGNLIAAIAVALMALIQDVWHIYILYVFIGLGGGFGGYIAGTTVVNNWFVKKRPLAMGMFVACAGIGGLVFPPVITALISLIGWRLTWVVLAVIYFIVAVLLGGVFLIRNRPEEMGLTPDGLPPNPGGDVPKINAGNTIDGQQRGWLMETVRTPVTWFITAYVATSALTMGTMNTHGIAYYQDIGFNPMTAATVASVFAVFNTFGSLTIGVFGLRFKIQYLTAIAFIFQITGLVILLTARSLPLIYLFAACLGIGWGGILTSFPTVVGANFSHDRYARVMGLIFPFQVFSQAVGAIAAGAIYDATGDYRLAFFCLAIVLVLGLACTFMVRQTNNDEYSLKIRRSQ
jgi:MFS family permease